jgi:hypothetical protein
VTPKQLYGAVIATQKSLWQLGLWQERASREFSLLNDALRDSRMLSLMANDGARVALVRAGLEMQHGMLSPETGELLRKALEGVRAGLRKDAYGGDAGSPWDGSQCYRSSQAYASKFTARAREHRG